MPTAAQILHTLSEISNRAIAVAVIWHLAVGAALIALAWGWKPRPRRFAALCLLPVISVSVLALAFGNPFNGATFAALAVVLAWAAWRSPAEAVETRPAWAAMTGALLIAFAWVYPHFLRDQPALTYLVASPMGLVPCPTLSLLVGLALAGYAPPGRAWSLVVAVAGLFYGLFGVLRLGVALDGVLLVGAAALAVQALGRWRTAPLPPRTAHLSHG